MNKAINKIRRNQFSGNIIQLLEQKLREKELELEDAELSMSEIVTTLENVQNELCNIKLKYFQILIEYKINEKMNSETNF